MKKIVSVMLLLMLAVSLVACSADKEVEETIEIRSSLWWYDEDNIPKSKAIFEEKKARFDGKYVRIEKCEVVSIEEDFFIVKFKQLSYKPENAVKVYLSNGHKDELISLDEGHEVVLCGKLKFKYNNSPVKIELRDAIVEKNHNRLSSIE
jgi:hypothetical protein